MCCVATSASSAYSATSASCAMPAPRLEGTECGLKVLPLASQRVYFVEPRARPDGPHDDEKKGTWRQPVIAPCAYLPSAEDRARTFVRNATSEQSMGAHSHTHTLPLVRAGTITLRQFQAPELSFTACVNS